MNKRAGVLYEYEFFTRALKQSLEVFIPAGDHLPVDCLVVNSDEKIFRVQIKGTSKKYKDYGDQKRNYDRYKVSAGTGQRSKNPIDCIKVDILAVYIEPEDLFYIVPCESLGGTIGPWFYPTLTDTKAKYEVYKENWEPFKANS